MSKGIVGIVFLTLDKKKQTNTPLPTRTLLTTHKLNFLIIPSFSTQVQASCTHQSAIKVDAFESELPALPLYLNMASIHALLNMPVKGLGDFSYAHTKSGLLIGVNAWSNLLDSSQPTETLMQASDPEYLLSQGKEIELHFRGQFSSSITGVYAGTQ